MTTLGLVQVILENLSPDARAVAPRQGHQPAIQTGIAGSFALVQSFAALPASHADAAGSCIHLSAGGRHLVIRHLDGRLVLEEGLITRFATVDEIVARLTAFPRASDAGQEESLVEVIAPDRRRDHGKGWIFAALVIMFALPWRAQA
jgi:hypothetical protein